MSKKTHKRRLKNDINAGSMADIAFLLLIFFLVTTTITEDQGILVKLPPFNTDIYTGQEVNENNVFTVKVNSLNHILAEKETISLAELKDATKIFITNPNNRKDRPSSPKNALVSLQNDRETAYSTYLAVYNELMAAYNELYEEEAQRRFNTSYNLLAKNKKKEIRMDIPLVISEAEPTDFK